MEPDDPDNYLRMAEMDRQLHRLDDAEKNIILAKQRAPGNLEVVYSEAMIYEAQGRYDDAIQMLSGAVESLKSEKVAAPSNRRTLAVLYEQLGRLYRESEKYPAAIDTFNEMGQLGDEEARRADVLIVDTYRAEDDLPHALEAAQKALAQYPEDRELRITRALLYGESGDADRGVSLLHELLAHSAEDLDIDLDMAQVYLENKRYTEAETTLAQAGNLATHDSDREMVWFMLGGVYEREKKYDRAEEEFKRVIAINPHSAQTLNYYGYMLADRGVRIPEAIELLKRALIEDPNNAAFLDSLGWAYYKQDRLAEAEDNLRQAVQRDHNDATMLDHLGDVYFKSGKLDLAEAQWEHSLVEWRRALPTEIEPDKIAALETKIANVKRQLAQQKTNNPVKQPQD
jgi:tetratricopeptide (TPR) repeat protein